jgi:hypothetical protein
MSEGWESLPEIPSNCPICGKKMEEGYVFACGSKSGYLCCSEEEPHSYWYPMPRKSDILLLVSFLHRDKEHWVRKGLRCQSCKSVLFFYSREASEKHSESPALEQVS